MSFKSVLKNIAGWLAVAGVSILLYHFFGLLFAVFFAGGVALLIWDEYNKK